MKPFAYVPSLTLAGKDSPASPVVSATPAEPERPLFGQTAVALGFTTQARFDAALHWRDLQRGSGEAVELIGATLRRLGLLTQSQVTAVLRQQNESEFQFADPQMCVPLRFGEVAVSLGYLTEDDLAESLVAHIALRNKPGGGAPFGSFLRAMGRLSAEQVSNVLRHQTDDHPVASAAAIEVAARLRAAHGSTDGAILAITAELSADAVAAAMDLALGLAAIDDGHILMIDANPKGITLHQKLNVRSSPGILDALAHPDSPVTPLCTQSKSLFVLPIGLPNANSMSLCVSPHARHLLRSFGATFKYVLVILGDVSKQTEASVLASHCDGVTFVVREGLTTKRTVDAVRRTLATIGVPLTGLVLTRRAITRRERKAA